MTRPAVGLLLAAVVAGPAHAQGRPPTRQSVARPAPRYPSIVQEALPPVVPAPQPRQRRLGLSELGLDAGAAFGAGGRDLSFPLPRDLPGLGGRLSLSFDLAAPFPARHAVEVRANGRLLAARAFPETSTRLAFDLPLPDEVLASEPDALRLNLRLVEQPGPAAGAATLRPESVLALMIPDGVVPTVSAMTRLLPARVVVLTRPGGLPPSEAAAALRIALALAATGRDARITSGGVPGFAVAPDGGRLWETGTVVVGATADAASVIEFAGVPVLAIGGPDPEGAARLLEGPWRVAAGTSAVGTAMAQPSPSRATSLPFSVLRGSLAAQEGARPSWTMEFSTRDLPPGTRPHALELELLAPPDSRGAIASVLLNDVLLGSSAVPPDGRLRLAPSVPAGLVALENRITVILHRAAAGAPAQLLPGSAMLLGAAPAASEFLALPPLLAGGFEVLVDAPGGTIPAEALNGPLWLLRALAPPGAPITVTPVAPGAEPRPRHPFLAATEQPPAGAEPPIRFEAGRIRLSDRAGARLMELDGTTPVLLAQLLDTGGAQGIWLRSSDGRMPPFAPPAAAPRLDRGDVAVLDRQGVALAISAAPPHPIVAGPPDTANSRSAVLAWRPLVTGVFWMAGFGLVAFAFLRPRTDTVA